MVPKMARPSARRPIRKIPSTGRRTHVTNDKGKLDPGGIDTAHPAGKARYLAQHEELGESHLETEPLFFQQCTFCPGIQEVPDLHVDLRDVQRAHLEGFDAIIHLAALSNDPLGDLNPEITYALEGEDLGVMDEAVDEGGGYRGVGEDRRPFTKGQVGHLEQKPHGVGPGAARQRARCRTRRPPAPSRRGLSATAPSPYHVLEEHRPDFPLHVYAEDSPIAIARRGAAGVDHRLAVMARDSMVAATRIGPPAGEFIRVYFTQHLERHAGLRWFDVGRGRAWLVGVREMSRAIEKLMEQAITIYTTREQLIAIDPTAAELPVRGVAPHASPAGRDPR